MATETTGLTSSSSVEHQSTASGSNQKANQQDVDAFQNAMSSDTSTDSDSLSESNSIDESGMTVRTTLTLDEAFVAVDTGQVDDADTYSDEDAETIAIAYTIRDVVDEEIDDALDEDRYDHQMYDDDDD
ncbi:MAG: hypothetical protein AAF968_02255 [Pseudomonadota bacterium]